MPYPGPYSFDGMTEHLWPAHSVDAGLLIYRPDGNQICQTLPPSQIPMYDGASGMLEHGYTASPIDNAVGAYSLATMPPDTMFSVPGLVSTPWAVAGADLNTHWNAESCTGISIAHMPHQLHGGMGVQSTTTPLAGTMFAHQAYDSSHMNALDKTVLPRTTGPSASTPFAMDKRMQSAHSFHQTSAVTVSKALFSELCAVSTQLLELGNAVPVVYELPTGLSEADAPMSSNSSTDSTDSARSGGRLSTRSSYSSLAFGDRPFPMDNLFALSQQFIEITQSVCRSGDSDLCSSRHDGIGEGPPFVYTGGSGTNATTGIGSEQVDAESFIVLVNSTYTAFLDVYQGVLHLVHATAKSAQPPVPISSRTSDGSHGTEDDMKQSLQNRQSSSNSRGHVTGTAAMPWKEETARCCLSVCRFPDVSVGGFSIVSTSALQLGLGLRLADDFLSHFSHTIALLHKCFPAALGGNVATMLGHSLSVADAAASACTTTYSPHHPPLVFAEGFYANGGIGMDGYKPHMPWDTAAAPSMSSLSTAGLLFTPPDDGMTGTQPVDDMAAHELQLRQELAVLRTGLST